MECSGPQGAIVFFGMQSPTGRLFDLLDADRNIIVSSTIEEMAKGLIPV